jgi:hypothetical protein
MSSSSGLVVTLASSCTTGLAVLRREELNPLAVGTDVDGPGGPEVYGRAPIISDRGPS